MKYASYMHINKRVDLLEKGLANALERIDELEGQISDSPPEDVEEIEPVVSTQE